MQVFIASNVVMNHIYMMELAITILDKSLICSENIEDNSNTRIYVSSKHKHASMWKHFITRGYNIISSWINLDGIIDLSEVGLLWPLWIKEAASADYLIFYAAPEDQNHNSCLLEIGACLAHGGTILHVGESNTMRTGNGKLADFTYMEKWKRISTLEKAFNYTNGEIIL